MKIGSSMVLLYARKWKGKGGGGKGAPAAIQSFNKQEEDKWKGKEEELDRNKCAQKPKGVAMYKNRGMACIEMWIEFEGSCKLEESMWHVDN